MLVEWVTDPLLSRVMRPMSAPSSTVRTIGSPGSSSVDETPVITGRMVGPPSAATR